MRDLPDHPVIEAMERTGYPPGFEDDRIYCENCGDDLTDEDVYHDGLHDILCERCLLRLHEGMG